MNRRSRYILLAGVLTTAAVVAGGAASAVAEPGTDVRTVFTAERFLDIARGGMNPGDQQIVKGTSDLMASGTAPPIGWSSGTVKSS